MSDKQEQMDGASPRASDVETIEASARVAVTGGFIDGDFNVKGCECKSYCEFPCWQRAGLDDTIGTPEYKCCCEGMPDIPDWIDKCDPREAFVVGAAQYKHRAATRATDEQGNATGTHGAKPSKPNPAATQSTPKGSESPETNSTNGEPAG